MRKTKMSDKGSIVWTAGIIVVCFALAISIAVICSQFIIKKDSYMNPSSFFALGNPVEHGSSNKAMNFW